MKAHLVVRERHNGSSSSSDMIDLVRRCDSLLYTFWIADLG